MNVRSVVPIAEARVFRSDEIFFSTTDEKGVILTGNDVFARVSGFSKTELYGRPHNIIRHPDMPRAAFALLWANLHAGRSFAGYVKNMAKDGRYYWVFVVAVPASNRRFLSVRFKPATALQGKVEALYAQMLAAENAELAKGGGEKDAVGASLGVALAALHELGFSDYDSFAQLALNQEMNARGTGRKKNSIPAYARVSDLFCRLTGFVEANLGLQQKATQVLGMAEDFRLHALNVNITAQHHGEAGGGLGIVAGFLGDCSLEMARGTDRLRTRIAEVMRITETINTRLSMAHLQMEMLLFYQAELAARPDSGDAAEVATLEDCFATSMKETLHGLTALRASLPSLCESRDTMARTSLMIEMAQILGSTETARIPDSAELKSMFLAFRGKMADTRTHLEELSAVVDRVAMITASAADLAKTG